MENILDPDSPPSTSGSANSDDLAFIDNCPLFAPSSSPLCHVSPRHNLPAIEVVSELPTPAVASDVIVASNDDVLVQDRTPEPEMLPITSAGIMDSCS